MGGLIYSVHRLEPGELQAKFVTNLCSEPSRAPPNYSRPLIQHSLMESTLYALNHLAAWHGWWDSTLYRCTAHRSCSATMYYGFAI